MDPEEYNEEDYRADQEAYEKDLYKTRPGDADGAAYCLTFVIIVVVMILSVLWVMKLFIAQIVLAVPLGALTNTDITSGLNVKRVTELEH